MSWRLLISAGQGPIECRWFVARLAAQLEDLAKARGLLVESSSWRGEVEAPKSVSLGLVGEAPRIFAPFLGTHVLLASGVRSLPGRARRGGAGLAGPGLGDRSPRRGRSGRKRWYVGVQLLEAIKTAPPLDPKDVEITTMRSGGPGGQHVNTTCSAVRAVHRPTGITVRVEGERSQHQNRARALEWLSRGLAEEAKAQSRHQNQVEWAGHHQLERGRPVQTWRLDPRTQQLVRVETNS
ncbi:MAG: peptide chain release factor H [Deltaproteobacteria bacterium]|nr:peptide chain release factor H [Deltaproteobacteria bacterium]